MALFHKKVTTPTFYEEDPAELRFDAMMDLVKDLSRKDYNRLKDAMDLGYNAYQKVRNIDSDDTQVAQTLSQMDNKDFIIHEKED